MRSRPVVAVTLLWTAGYALAAGAELSILSYVTSLALAAAACIVWIFPFPGHKLLCGLLVILVAAGYYEAYDRGNQSHFIAAGGQSEDAVTETSISLEGVIVSPVEVDGDKAAFILASAAVDGERFAVNVKLLTQGEQETARRWQRSDLVSLQGSAKLPEEARNFGGFDYRGYLKLQHIHWQISVKGAESISVRPPVSWTLERVLRWNDQLRDRLGQCVEQLFPALQSGFMKGMLVGLTDDLNPLQFQQFSQLGLTHIIAISGLNVTIFLGCLIWLMRRLGFTRETYLITAILLMPLYIAVTGASPSIIRAGLMAMVALYAAYRHALKDGLHIVLLVGMAMLVWEPYYLLDVSFQLSFLVTIGLILGVPHVSRMLPIRSRAWRDAVSIAVVAQAVSFPVSIYYFNQFSLLSLAANLCLVPLFSMAVMPAGTAAMLLGLIYLPAGKVIAWPVTWLNEWIFAIVETASRWGVFQTIWRTPGFGWMFCYYGGAVFLLYGVHLYKQSFIPPEAGPMLQIGFSAAPQEQAKKWMPLKSAVLLSAAMLWMILLLFWGYDAERRGGQGEVDFIDVGQGDSILIRSPVSNSILLIDGGGTVTFGKPGDDWKKRKDPYEVGRKLLVPLLKKRGIQQIDYLVISHQDADHIGGLQAVLEQIPVREVVFNGTFKPGAAVEKLFQTALAQGAQLVKAYSGDRLEVDEKTSLQVLFPIAEAGADAIRIEKEQNGESLVLLMSMLGTKWLFTGDVDEAGEHRMLDSIAQAAGKIGNQTQPNSSAPLPALASTYTRSSRTSVLAPIDVLKVAHHGSKTSSSEAWLDAWQPRLAVISVGEHNVYGHPSPVVTARLQERKTGVLRTDLHGEVQMRVTEDGQIHVRSKLKQ